MPQLLAFCSLAFALGYLTKSFDLASNLYWWLVDDLPSTQHKDYLLYAFFVLTLLFTLILLPLERIADYETRKVTTTPHFHSFSYPHPDFFSAEYWLSVSHICQRASRAQGQFLEIGARGDPAHNELGRCDLENILAVSRLHVIDKVWIFDRVESSKFYSVHSCGCLRCQGEIGTSAAYLTNVKGSRSIPELSNSSRTQLSDVENALVSLANETQGALADMNKMCGVGPMVLGVCTSTYENEHESHQFLRAKGVVERKQSANLWMTIQLQRNCMPLLRSVYCCGYRYHSVSSEVVFYKQPNPTALQYLSLEPLTLDTSGKEGFQQNYPEKTNAGTGGSEKDNETLTVKNMRKVVAHSRIFSSWKNRGSDDVEVILNQINSSFILEWYIRNRCTETLKSCSKYGICSALTAAFSRIKNAVAKSVPVGFGCPYIKPALTQTALVFLFVTRLISEIIFLILNYRMPKWLKGYALKDLSAAAQQIDLRLQLFCFWPWQYMLLRPRDWKNTAAARAQYISFYNSLWLVVNDIILGVATGAFLMDNNQVVADVFMEYLDHYAIDSLESMMVWLMGWPAGLKLNSELDKFLGDLFLWLIRLWAVCINPLRPFIPIIFYLIGTAGIGGASVIFALLGDFLSLMTLHVYWFYIVAARIYNRQLTILHSLFNLFQGKKHNTLRKRIDSCDYDLDQLLLGTVLFTLLTFLFPTVLVYYLTFSASRVSVIILQGIPDTILALLNHFPLFAIMLRFKDPERLPGGLRIDVCAPDHFLQTERTWTQVLLSPIVTLSTTALHEKAQSDEVSKDAGRDRIGPKATLRSRIQTFGISTTYANDDEKRDESDHASLLRHRRKEKKDMAEYTAGLVSSGFGEGGRTRRDENEGVGGEGEGGSATGWPGPWRVTTYLYLKNLPTPMTALFFQYVLLWRRIASHYLSFYVFRCLLHGEAIRPVERLQYPMLPERKQLATHELIP